MRSLLAFSIFSIASASFLFSVQAQAASPAFAVQNDGSTISFNLTNPRLPHTGAQLIVTGPGGYARIKEFAAGDNIHFSPLRDGATAEGQFNFELRLISVEEPRAGMGMPQAESQPLPRMRGAFAVASGMIISDDSQERGGRDQVIADDQIIQGSLCVGVDCVNGEDFSFSTVVIKENNTRLRFTDTSNSASFPSTDWELRANDSTNGGSNQFAITDLSAGQEILIVEAGAPESALHVDGAGQVGVGTGTPLLNLHVTDSNTPAMRLDQDGTGGFAAQSWDVGGNEVEFFVRNATSLTIPFSVDVNAPDDSLVIDMSGNLGLGAFSPEANLHIRDDSTRAGIKLETAGAAWETAVSGNRFTIDDAATGATELALDANGDLSVAGSLRTSSPVELPTVALGNPSEELAGIEAHIARYGQLPGIGNARAQGHDVIEFQMQLLEAIQQLTLQNIEQQKEIEALRGQISRMRR